MKLKQLVLILGLLLPALSYAGQCELMLSSEEIGKLMFHDGRYTKLAGEFTLEECLEEAQQRLGSIKHMQTLIRNDYRYITTVNCRFSDNQISSQIRLDLKNKRRPN